MSTAPTRRINVFEGTLVAAGLLAFVSSFLPWFTVSEHVTSVLIPSLSSSASQSTIGWTSGIFAWLPVLLLVFVAARVLLPLFGVLKPHKGYRLYLGLAVAAVLLIAIRWGTFPSPPAADAQDMSMGPGIGLYLGLIAALGAAVVSFLGFRAPKPAVNASPTAS